MRKTYRHRLYPTKAQDAALHDQLDEACRLYNAALQERRDAWKLTRHSVKYYEQANQLKAIRADGTLAVANYSACQDVLRRVDKTFKAFFARVKRGERAGYPRFKPRQRYDSLTFPSYGDGCKLLDTGRLRLQGAGDVKVKLHRPVEGTVKTVTVKREAGRWYACFSVECEPAPLPPTGLAVGIDLGLSSFAVLSDGAEIPNPRQYRRAQAKLRRAQRRVRRRRKGGNGRRKAVRELQRAHAHVRAQRADFHHKLARQLVDGHDLIAVEDLNIKGLAGSMLAKPIHDAGWGMFLDKLAYKAESAGRTLVRVSPAGTTQTCSGCGLHVPKTLAERQHRCSACGLNIGRDLNAARNILGLGLSLVGGTWPDGASVPTEAVCFG